ncbi:MAG TPA: thiamine pyrophosphate-dependent enzyme [Capsulimonadaceae bacterium]|jgi:indolepyruvate ferredoxin oxidoreductase alpha subunit
MDFNHRLFLSGDEAVALAARHAGVALMTGYPGTPSTEIVESFVQLGGKGQWAPNEKVAFEVAIGASFGNARTMVTMKHVGLNVAADPLFTAAYAEVAGGLVVVSADDPGMASSQNEQDNRHYAVAAAVPMLEPADSQEAYEFTLLAFAISERWRVPVMLRMTTRVCHAKTVVYADKTQPERIAAFYERDIAHRVMIPANAKPAHRRLRAKLAEMTAWNEAEGPNKVIDVDKSLGIICSGISFMHVREAAPDATVLKLGMSYPLPFDTIRQFAESVDRCVVIEEGDPWLIESLRAVGVTAESKPDMYRFGELNVERVRRILSGDVSPEFVPPRGKPPELCPACPHRTVYTVLTKLNCIVQGDIGCYSLGALPPFEGMESLICMGASIGMGLGLRHVLPADEASRVVSVIGDSTFVHSGITGLVEMVYNPPPTGHVVLILDNGTTAMTGMQEHPATGRKIDHQPTGKVILEDVARAIGIRRVHVIDPTRDQAGLESLLTECLASRELAVIICRKPCVLAAGKIMKAERELAAAAG